jgi:hypothetical protein
LGQVKDTAGRAVDQVTDMLGTLTVSYEDLELGYSPSRSASKTHKQMLDDDALWKGTNAQPVIAEDDFAEDPA